MFTNYKIIRNTKGQFIMKTTFIAATKYHLKRIFRIISLSTFTALIIALAITYGAYTTQSTVSYAQVTTTTTPSYPILKKVATCESKGQQFHKDGTLVFHINTNNTIDIGEYEINSIWEAKSISLGYNIYTAEGNYNMALYLFTNYGTEPWASSKPCWIKL